ncbi:LEA type 2 family protein [Acidobacteria bacterium ACD]|nr:MAG: hypothetical protein EDX89_08090 [Acidobacteriota bacterium]MCE7957758.1 hypothetical protein [Acidobacteria bacterium ACB2]MDL1950195.1 LEA type 2 family protein [Acidobacteria bacterium ACD]
MTSARSLAPPSLLLAALLALPAAPAEREVGSVERLELTSLTRERAGVWARTRLPRAAKGARQTFDGEVTVANVRLPVGQPVTVAVQERPTGAEAVFLLDIDLRKVPEELVTRMGTHAVDPVLTGRLRGDGGTEVPVHAVGVIRFGTPQLVAPASNATRFVRYAGARLSGLGLAESTGEARAFVYNPFGFPLDVRSLSYSLWLGERRVVTGELRGIRLHPARENEVRIPLRALNSDLVAAAGQAVLAGGELDGELMAQVELKAGRDGVTFPLKLPGKVRLVR